MIQQIEEDHNRFRKIIKGKIKENLRKYISHGEMIGKKGKRAVSIPIPQIDLPRFRYGDPKKGGIGKGDGKEGDPIDAEEGEEAGKAGNLPGKHLKEVEITIEELAEILGEELELPKIEPKGKNEIISKTDKYSGIRRTGPESLRHFKRTYQHALKRQIAAREYNKDNPIIIPIKEDMRYRSWKTQYEKKSNAVVIYMMDVSGSMWEEQKEIVRIETFWIDTWLNKHYQGLKTRYIIHDAKAAEVDRDTFFTTKESGGTVISTAYDLCAKIIENEYPGEEWNIYPFHFSDGDNWSKDDNSVCFKILEERIFPMANVFCYGQVESSYGSGQFLKDLQEHFKDNEDLLTSTIPSRDDIYDSIKTFLGKGK
jgi:sporulation protein YhbH